jgi:hypothetical protein|tara:strand:- start:167 stop:445 length:279 start_codon:yes stop_codon:yes gene_type:complete
MKPEHIEDVLVPLHSGQWFGWSDAKNKVYENLVIQHADKEKPTKAWLESELASQQAAWDADASDKETNKASAKSKLAALGLSADEISATFGI